MWVIIDILDILLFSVAAIAVAYLLFFCITSTRYGRVEPGITRKKGRFLIITTGTSADTGIEDTIKSVIKQEYDKKDFDLVVVGNKMTPLQAIKLAQYPITLLTNNDEDSTKSQAQKYAIQNLRTMKVYDAVILIDPDETVPTDFLIEVNKVLQTGQRFFQLHRRPQNINTTAAILSSTMEEINNSIFRKGHVVIGMPSSLIGSSVVLDYNWFKQNVAKIDAKNEEKSLESLLIRDKIFVDYIDDVCVYVRPIENRYEIADKRKRWMENKFSTFLSNVKQLLPAMLHMNRDLADKLFQWIMVPRILLMALIIGMSLLMPFIYFTLAIKWWVMLLLITFGFALATPDYLVTDEWIKSFLNAPILLASSVYNILFNNIVTRKLFAPIRKIRKK